MDHSPVFKQVTLENLEAEHICCCISDKKGENCVSSKKSWLRNRMQEGLVFNKLDVRGKGVHRIFTGRICLGAH